MATTAETVTKTVGLDWGMAALGVWRPAREPRGAGGTDTAEVIHAVHGVSHDGTWTLVADVGPDGAPGYAPPDDGRGLVILRGRAGAVFEDAPAGKLG